MRTFLILLLILGFSILMSSNFFIKSPGRKQFLKLNRKNLYKWMNLTKKERFDLSKRDSINYLNQRKNLLNKIRSEYKNIPKKQ
tara:strand:+ start:201 stop:452 length:252 start_codon:yes stop_codon:yes gene_type:complete